MSSTKVKKSRTTCARLKGGSDTEPLGNNPLEPADGNLLGVIEEEQDSMSKTLIQGPRENSSSFSPFLSLGHRTPENSPRTLASTNAREFLSPCQNSVHLSPGPVQSPSPPPMGERSRQKRQEEKKPEKNSSPGREEIQATQFASLAQDLIHGYLDQTSYDPSRLERELKELALGFSDQIHCESDGRAQMTPLREESDPQVPHQSGNSVTQAGAPTTQTIPKKVVHYDGASKVALQQF
jgi:hypothetical protein